MSNQIRKVFQNLPILPDKWTIRLFRFVWVQWHGFGKMWMMMRKETQTICSFTDLLWCAEVAGRGVESHVKFRITWLSKDVFDVKVSRRCMKDGTSCHTTWALGRPGRLTESDSKWLYQTLKEVGGWVRENERWIKERRWETRSPNRERWHVLRRNGLCVRENIWLT